MSEIGRSILDSVRGRPPSSGSDSEQESVHSMAATQEKEVITDSDSVSAIPEKQRIAKEKLRAILLQKEKDRLQQIRKKSLRSSRITQERRVDNQTGEDFSGFGTPSDSGLSFVSYTPSEMALSELEREKKKLGRLKLIATGGQRNLEEMELRCQISENQIKAAQIKAAQTKAAHTRARNEESRESLTPGEWTAHRRNRHLDIISGQLQPSQQTDKPDGGLPPQVEPQRLGDDTGQDNIALPRTGYLLTPVEFGILTEKGIHPKVQNHFDETGKFWFECLETPLRLKGKYRGALSGEIIDIFVEAHQSGLRRLDDTLRGAATREDGPPKDRELLSPGEVEKLQSLGYQFRTRFITDKNDIEWQQVTEFNGFDPDQMEGYQEDDLVLPFESEPLTGHELYKFVQGGVIPVCGERVDSDGVVHFENLERYFSKRNQSTGERIPIDSSSGYFGDYNGIMLENGRARIARAEDMQELATTKRVGFSTIKVQSPPITEEDWETTRAVFGNQASNKSLRNIFQNTKSHTRREEENMGPPLSPKILVRNPGVGLADAELDETRKTFERNCSVEIQDDSPKSIESTDTPSSKQKGNVSPLTLGANTDLKTKVVKAADLTEGGTITSNLTSQYLVGEGGYLVGRENKEAWESISGPFKTSKKKVARAFDLLTCVPVQAVPTLLLRDRRENLRLRVHKLQELWNQKVQHMGESKSKHEIPLAKKRLDDCHNLISFLEDVEEWRKNGTIPTPDPKIQPHEVALQSDCVGYDEDGTDFNGREWEKNLLRYIPQAKSQAEERKKEKKRKPAKQVGFPPGLKSDFEYPGKRIATSTPAVSSAGNPQRNLFGNKVYEDEITKRLETLASELEAKNRQERLELQKRLEGELEMKLEREREKTRRLQEMAEDRRLHYESEIASFRNNASTQGQIGSSGLPLRYNKPLEIDPKMSDVVRTIENRTQQGPYMRTIPSMNLRQATHECLAPASSLPRGNSSSQFSEKPLEAPALVSAPRSSDGPSWSEVRDLLLALSKETVEKKAQTKKSSQTTSKNSSRSATPLTSPTTRRRTGHLGSEKTRFPSGPPRGSYHQGYNPDHHRQKEYHQQFLQPPTTFDNQGENFAAPQMDGRPRWNSTASQTQTGVPPPPPLNPGYNPSRPLDKIPTKTNIKKFGGALEEYAIFQAKFNTVVGNKNLPLSDKAVYLVDSLEKDPLNLATAIVGGRFDDFSLGKIWYVLNEHYGGERRRKAIPLLRLRNLGFIAKFVKTDLLNFHVVLTEIRSYYTYRDSHKLWEENSEMVCMAREKIAPVLQMEYFSFLKQMGYQDNFVSFANWIKEKLEIQQHVEESMTIKKASERTYKTLSAEEIDCGVVSQTENDSDNCENISAAGQDYHRNQKPQKGVRFEEFRKHKTTIESLANKSSLAPTTEKVEELSCSFCQKNHRFYACPEFDKIPHDEKNDFVRKHKICYHCLNPGHIAAKCDYFPARTCKVDNCTGSHHKKLHPPKFTSSYSYEEWYDDEVLGSALDHQSIHTHDEQTLHGDGSTYVAIRTVPAILHYGNKKRRLIVALDACSNNTNISQSLAQELGLKVLEKGLDRRIGFLERVVTVKSDLVAFNLCPLDESASFQVEAYTVKDLVKDTPVVDWKEEAKKYPHLRMLEIPERLPSDKVDILLGTDHAYLMAVIKSFRGGVKEPIAEKTALGLAFSGKLKNCLIKRQNVNGLSISDTFFTLANISSEIEENLVIAGVTEGTSPITGELEDVPLSVENPPHLTEDQNLSTIIQSEKSKNPPIGETISEKKKPFTIVVEGNIGSGKSTFLNLIAKIHPDQVEIQAEPVEKWQDCQGHNLLQEMYDDPQKNSFAFQIFVQLTRIMQNELPSNRPIRLIERSILSSRYCFIENLHQKGLVARSEFAVLDEWFKFLMSNSTIGCKVDKIIYLRADPETSFERITKRDRSEESKIPFEYIKDLHNLHEDWLIRRTRFQPLDAPVQVINANEDLLSLANKLSLEELISVCDSAVENYKPHGVQDVWDGNRKLSFLAEGSAAKLTPEDLDQDPQSSEKYSTFWDRVLHDMLKSLWEQDKILLEELTPVYSSALKETDKNKWTKNQIASDNKLKVIYVPEKGQFQASIPWKFKPRLRNNRFAVQKRQRNCEAGLRAKGTSLEEIRTIFETYHKKGYIRKLTETEAKEYISWFIPWSVVVDPQRDTTKVRVVYDASARDGRGISLNSEIELGPNRLQDLHKILMRLRKFEFVVTSDISEMFLKILLDPEHRKFHRFVFQDEVWEWLVILFGNLSSPNASQKVLELCCLLFGENLPEAVETILNSCFMDDCCDTRETEEKAAQLVRELVELLANANMSICKFYSNSKLALEACDENLLAKQIKFEDKTVVYETSKVLGMAYSADETDSLHFVGKFQSQSQWTSRKGTTVVKAEDWTKRLVLQAAAAIFDPTGLISPYTVCAKRIMQDIWRSKIGWDEKVNPEIVKRFLNWIGGVFDLTDLRIPRWTGFSSKCTRLEVHTFCDASEEGYCVAVYTRVVNYDNVVTTLVTAKSRVSPLKSESISRMELIACLLGTRIWSAIRGTYPSLPEHTFFWTDSMVCLYWISETAKTYRAFVAHRLGEIQKVTDPDQWRHIPTAINPADIGTRDILAVDLKQNELWFKGPGFLRSLNEVWPKTEIIRGGDKKEEKPVSSCFVTLKSFQSSEVRPDAFESIHPRHFSVSKKKNGFVRCIRIWATFLRAAQVFRKRWKPKVGSSALTQEEIDEAKKCLIKDAQREFYEEELPLLEETKTKSLCVVKDCRWSEIMKFNPKLDEDGILRSNSRLANIDFYPYERKFPIILPRKAEFTRLLVEHFHVHFEHALGHSALKAEVQAEYAIHGLGTLIAQVNSRCQECRVKRAKLSTQQMAPLPTIRCNEQVKPFFNVGLDYAGPFSLKVGRGKVRKQVSVLVFTCLQVRAVHFEVTEGQTTSHVLNAISRFADIRGVPKTIISDNQTSFHKADKDLREWLKSIDFKEIEEKTGFNFRPNSKGIQWIFNPPVSPHFGGVYETIVKSMKRALYSTIRKADLNEDGFRTAISGAMAILNSRPISETGKQDDFEALTPDHFLKSHLKGAVFPPNVETSMNMRERYRHIDVILNHLWSRFHKEIPGRLVPRKKWSEEQPNLKVGDLVAELDHTIPRREWRYFRVSEVLPGADGLIRRVKIINSDGRVYERGIARLLPIVCN